MAIYEVDDLDSRIDHLGKMGVRIVWAGDFSDIRGRHLHPRDVGGALVSIDQPVPNGSWRWGGPDWVPHTDTAVVSGIAVSVLSADDPDAMRLRWTELAINTSVGFIASGSRGEGLDRVDLVATDRDRVGETSKIGGVTFVLV